MLCGHCILFTDCENRTNITMVSVFVPLDATERFCANYNARQRQLSVSEIYNDLQLEPTYSVGGLLSLMRRQQWRLKEE